MVTIVIATKSNGYESRYDLMSQLLQDLYSMINVNSKKGFESLLRLKLIIHAFSVNCHLIIIVINLINDQQERFELPSLIVICIFFAIFFGLLVKLTNNGLESHLSLRLSSAHSMVFCINNQML